MELHPYEILVRIPRNPCKIKQNRSRTSTIIITTVVSLIVIFFISSKLSFNQVTLLGVAGSTIFAVSVFFLSRNAQEQKEYSIARSNAHILSSIINHVEIELLRIKDGDTNQIDYPRNWLEIYTNTALFLTYDYMSVLIEEFSTIDKINVLVEEENYFAVQQMITMHWNRKFTRWNCFDIDALKLNLSSFSSSLCEQKHWTEEKLYRDLATLFFSKYSSKVHSLSIEFLTTNLGHADREETANYVISHLKNDEAFKKEFSLVTLYDRFHLLNIFQVHLNAKYESSYALCWGELTLKID